MSSFSVLAFAAVTFAFESPEVSGIDYNGAPVNRCGYNCPSGCNSCTGWADSYTPGDLTTYSSVNYCSQSQSNCESGCEGMWCPAPRDCDDLDNHYRDGSMFDGQFTVYPFEEDAEHLGTEAVTVTCRFAGRGADHQEMGGADVTFHYISGSTDLEKDAACDAKCNANPDCEFWVRATDIAGCWLKKDFTQYYASTIRRGAHKDLTKWNLGQQVTHSSAETFCASLGGRLPYKQELCDGNSPRTFTSLSGDMWVPVSRSGVNNDWVQIGDMWGRTCWSHNDHYGAATWTEDSTNLYSWRSPVYCVGASSGVTRTSIALGHPNHATVAQERQQDGWVCGDSSQQDDYAMAGSTSYHEYFLQRDSNGVYIEQDVSVYPWHTMTNSGGVHQINVGHAGDCNAWANCDQVKKGSFQIDLRGTSLALRDSVSWEGYGWPTWNQALRNYQRAPQMASGNCGNWCGGVQADRRSLPQILE